jgi:hypothetical protein
MIATPCDTGCTEETADVPDEPSSAVEDAERRWERQVRRADLDEGSDD